MFASSWPRVVAAVSALVFSTLLGAALLAAPPASAVDLPIVGTAECEAEVARAATVIAANEALEEAERDAAAASDAAADAREERDDAAAVLSGIGAGLPGFGDAAAAVVTTGQALDRALAEETNAQGRVADAERVVADVERAATETLCTTETVDETAPTPTLPPSTTVEVPPTETVVAPAPTVTVGDRDCTDFATPANAQAFYNSVTTPAVPDPSRLDRDGDGVACETEDVAVVVELDPLADDGSVADTDGTQITIVPAGSVSTGGGA